MLDQDPGLILNLTIASLLLYFSHDSLRGLLSTSEASD